MRRGAGDGATSLTLAHGGGGSALPRVAGRQTGERDEGFLVTNAS